MDQTISPITARPQAALRSQLERARKALLDTGSRNRLIHTPRNAQRSKSIDLLAGNADEVFRTLVRERRTASFRAAEEGEADHREAVAEQGGRLRTRLSPEMLQRRLLGLQRDAKTAQEEQGVDLLYLAIGFLRWFEDPNSEVLREAPLVLVPVVLRRDDARSVFRLAVRDDDIETNMCLQEMLKEHGITLPDIEDHEEWTPGAYFDRVRPAISAQTRWSVDENGMVLGFFSFSKHLMVRDLNPESWPGQSLVSHQQLNSLLVAGFSGGHDLIAEDAKPDEVVDIATLPYVLDADASQALVIENVRAGHDLVVQGPPGTGKSQTIANMIAAAVGDGKAVLFVAEKMAALTVVHDRLVRAGLELTCLELHSRKANKRAVIATLERALGAPVVASSDLIEPDRLRDARDRLNTASVDLHARLPFNGITPFRALAEQVSLRAQGHPAPTFSLPESASWPPDHWSRIQSQVAHLAEQAQRAGKADHHPWRGVVEEALQPADRERLQHTIADLGAVATEVSARMSELASLFGFEPDQPISEISIVADLAGCVANRPAARAGIWEVLAATERLERLSEIATLGLAFRTAREPVAETFVASAIERDAEALRTPLAAGSNSLFARLRKDYRRASRELGGLLKVPLPKAPDRRVQLVDSLIRVRKLAADLAAEATFAAAVLKDEWQGDRTDFALLYDATRWLGGLRGPKGISRRRIAEAPGAAEHWRGCAQALRDCGNRLVELFSSIVRTLRLDVQLAFGTASLDDVRIATLLARVMSWSAEPERLDEWLGLRAADQAVRAAGLTSLADRVNREGFNPASITAELRYARAEAIWKAAVAARPALTTLTGPERSELTRRFGELDRRRRSSATADILARYQAGRPTGAMGDMAVIRGEIARTRGHMPIRRLLEKAGRTVQRIKPVFLMSPLSVAQFLPPGSLGFDLLVIDEASQVKPEDALGAFGRAKQIVVVGDKQQLPPTSFFERLVSSDDSTDAEEDDGAPLSGAAPLTTIESVLGLCEARGMPSRMLRWHYRSRHPSLIEVSNAEFYEQKLFMPPSPSLDRNSEGLTLTRVPGAYDRGGKRTNQIEAEAIVAAVRDHARTSPELSLGVVTFSSAQKALLDDLMEAAQRNDPDLDAFVNRSAADDFFVKNLENVQGDERDTIYISVGYGPRIAGAPLDSMSFGPVSTDGGGRRLNVLFTRARRQTRVFASFGSDDIDLARSGQAGPRILKRFLRYAETGVIDQPLPTGQDPDSPFEEAVADAIKGMGFQVDLQVGSAGFCIDLAVRDPDRPGRYLLAVECDGAMYHSARWARERDRLRQEVLEGLGWKFYRIWSTDWFRTPGTAKNKLSQAIERARAEALQSPSSSCAAVIPAPPATSSVPEPVASAKAKASPYTEAWFPLQATAGPHEIPLSELSGIVARIVAVEGPIHEDEVARRLTRLAGRDRAGNRILAQVRQALRHAAAHSGTVRNEGAFWMPTAADWKLTVRDRSSAAPPLQRPDRIADSEVELAVTKVLGSNGGLPMADIPVAVVRLFGFQRTGVELRKRIESVLGRMLTKGLVVAERGYVRLGG